MTERRRPPDGSVRKLLGFSQQRVQFSAKFYLVWIVVTYIYGLLRGMVSVINPGVIEQSTLIHFITLKVTIHDLICQVFKFHPICKINSIFLRCSSVLF